MIAVVGIPGSIHHTWRRFDGRTERAQAEEWMYNTERKIRYENAAVGTLECATYSEREAAKIRYLDGTRVYPQEAVYQ